MRAKLHAGFVGQILQRRAAGQLVVEFLDPVGDLAAGGVGALFGGERLARFLERWFPAPRGCRSCGKAQGRGPRARGPTTPGSVSAKTASPAAPRSACDCSPRSMSASARPRSATSVSKVSPASSRALAAAASASVGIDQPLDQTALGLHEFGDALLVGVAQRLLVQLDGVGQHLGQQGRIGDALGLGRGEHRAVRVVEGLQLVFGRVGDRARADRPRSAAAG